MRIPERQPWREFANRAAYGYDFSTFPQTAAGFANLPTVSFITPNDDHNMTPLSDNGGGVAAGDACQANLSAYVSWAKNNNSLLIVTFDENNTNPAVMIPLTSTTLVVGAGVPAGVLMIRRPTPFRCWRASRISSGLTPIGENGHFVDRRFLCLQSRRRDIDVHQLAAVDHPSHQLSAGKLACRRDTLRYHRRSARLHWTNLSTNQTNSGSTYTLWASAPNNGTTQSLLDSRALYDSASGL